VTGSVLLLLLACLAIDSSFLLTVLYLFSSSLCGTTGGAFGPPEYLSLLAIAISGLCPA
jgi:hypothetical protein